MSFRTILFEGMIIKGIAIADDLADIQIEKAVIVKNMDGAEDDTKWQGFGSLIIEDLVICDEDDLPEFPCTIKSADVKDNQMTYRNEALIPIDCYGNVGISIQFEGSDKTYKFIGEKMQFDVAEHEKYIEHIKK